MLHAAGMHITDVRLLGEAEDNRGVCTSSFYFYFFLGGGGQGGTGFKRLHEEASG